MRLFRLVGIFWVFSRYRLDTFLADQRMPWWLRCLLWLLPLRWLIPVKGNQGTRLRLALESLGPVFIKFGQILSTRRDLLPADLATELAYLQDRVTAFSGEQATQIIEHAFGESIHALFAQFDRQPLASASIAQVHKAELPDGRDVVVKVIRPGIKATILKDIGLMELLALLLEKIPDGRRLRPIEVVKEFRQTILDELDLLREGANLATLRRNFEDSEALYMPWVDWHRTRRNVLTMERIHGIPVADMEALKQAGVNLKVLAERGVEVFFTQVFRDSFFHADMHPGNIFVNPTNPESPQYIGVDCGIVGTLSPEDQQYLAQNMLAFFNRDYYRVAQLHIESGWVPAHTRVNEFESAIRSVCEPIFEKPLAEISFGLLLIRLFQTARRFDMSVQPQLVLLEKTLLNIEGLGRQLYPQLDLWATAKPYLEKSMHDQVGPKALLKAIKQHGPSWLAKAPLMPDLLHDTLVNLKRLETHQQEKNQDVQQNQRYLKRQIQRYAVALAFLMMLLMNPSWQMFNTIQWLGLALVTSLIIWR